jgi:hypothetical protein
MIMRESDRAVMIHWHVHAGDFHVTANRHDSVTITVTIHVTANFNISNVILCASGQPTQLPAQA